MPVVDTLRLRTGQVVPWFALLALLIFCGEALGYAACQFAGATPPRTMAWVAFAAVALVMGGSATVLLDWLILDGHRRLAQEAAISRGQAAELRSAELALASRIEQQRRLRHDIRGVLSPILLTADRLVNHSDPAVQRSGAILVRTVERATVLLTDQRATPPQQTAHEEAAANPPADP